MPKISVIIPVYNVEKYLERCLKSVLEQPFCDIEVICINNGSSDNSLKILEKFKMNDGRVKVINQENLGQSVARNMGIAHATGDYISFVDSDDWVSENFFTLLYEGAIKYNADVVMSDFIRKGKNKHKIRLNLKNEAVFCDMKDKMKAGKTLHEGCCWNKIYRREMLLSNNISFAEGVIYEDGLFTHKALYYSNKLAQMVGCYYYYFINPKSTVKKKRTQKSIDDEIMCKHDILDFLTQKKIFLRPCEFLATSFKLKVLGLTLFSKKCDQFVEITYLFGVLPVKKREIALDSRVCAREER